MTPLELDQLVREIGEEVQRRLGPAAPNAHVCACGTAVPVSANGAASTRVAPQEGVASSITQALLWPGAGEEEIRRACRELRQHGFASVCVQPSRVAAAVRELRGANVAVAAVIGYPQGATLTPVKLAEAAQVLKLGASELELTIHPGALRWGDLDAVYTEIRLAVECAHEAGAALKVLAEMSAMDDEQKATICALARLAGADTIKTSLDLAGAASSGEDVALAHRIVGGELGIEAAGGVDNYSRFLEMMEAGATRVATAAGVAILSEAMNA
jgi:deoxyribose-phosphate aldolase